MSSTAYIPTPVPEEALSSSVRDYITLLKPRVMTLVVFCGFVGMLLAPGHLHPLLQAVTVLCIALGSGAGGAINMWYDRDIDAVMRRTATRPVPAGRITPENALAFGVALSLLSVSLLGLATNWLAAGLLAAAIGTYVGVYTIWLKRRTPQNIVIGGAAGAFPPMIGWAAVTGGLGWEPVLLFALIFFWTPPHFWALAICIGEEYAKVGVPMLPTVAGEKSTRLQILLYSVLVTALSLLPVAMGFMGTLYLGLTVLFNVFWLYYAWKVYRSTEKAEAWRMFKYSLAYLFLLFAGMLADKFLF